MLQLDKQVHVDMISFHSKVKIMKDTFNFIWDKS